MACGMVFDVEQDYFHWLCEIINVDQDVSSWWLLMNNLHHTEFYALIPHDENRALDGLTLREEYLNDIRCPKYVELNGECSVLEMMIALAKRMEYATFDPYSSNGVQRGTSYWFWEMIRNLGLLEYSDDEYMELGGIDDVSIRVRNFLNRAYEFDGDGGLFPLRCPNQDQRDIEIWAQMNAYLEENEAC